jgi:hypothetical protein
MAIGFPSFHVAASLLHDGQMPTSMGPGIVTMVIGI